MNNKIFCPVESLSIHAPDSIALISKDETLTYRQFHQRIFAAQINCQSQKIRRGTKVAIQSPNSIEYIVLLFALWRIGAVACLLSPRTPQKEIKRQLVKLNCKISIWLGRVTRKRGPQTHAAAGVPHGGMGAASTSGVLTGQDPTRYINFLFKDYATIMFTSGSSGEPKAVVHTIGNHYFNALGSNENIPVKQNDCWLLSLPLYHVSGLSIIWRTILGGGTIALPDPSENLSDSIKKYKVTHLSLVATQLIRTLKSHPKTNALKNLKAVLLGGGPIPDELMQKAQKFKLPVFATYGLTEMASQVATSKKPINGKIKTLKYRQLKVSKGGEILVRGQVLFKGYLKNGKIMRPIDAKGWFHTGDLGSYNNRGGLCFLGRKDNMFISGGENIYPEEIEKALINTGIVEQAVVIAVKNTEFGLRPVAFIKCHKNKKLPTSKIKMQLAKTLPRFKIPNQIYNIPAKFLKHGIKVNRQVLKTYLNLS